MLAYNPRDFDYSKCRSVIVGLEPHWPSNIADMIIWCSDNCVDDWAYGLHHGGVGGTIVYAFYFYDPGDYFTFNLVWGIV